MPNTACVGYNEIDSRSHLAISLLANVRRAIDHAAAHVLVAALLLMIDELFKRLVARLTPEMFERMQSVDKQKTVEALRLLVEKLDETREAADSLKRIPFGCVRSFRSIYEHGDQLGDILESFELSLNLDFKHLVDRSLSDIQSSGRPRLAVPR